MKTAIQVCVLLVLAGLTLGRAFIWRTPDLLWADAAAKAPLRPRPRFNIAAALMSQGRYDEALEQYQAAEVLSLASNATKHEREMTQLLVAMDIADILIRQRRVEEAHQVLKQGWMVNPGFPGYAANLGWFYLHGGEPEKATAILVEGIAHFKEYPWFPKKGSLYLNLGTAMLMEGHCDAAKEAYAVAREYYETFKEPACL